MRATEFVTENTDHSKNDSAVEELRAALVTRRDRLQAATDDEVYTIIDRIMTRIANKHNISGKNLHDMWVHKYKQVPDTWIMQEDVVNRSNIELRHEPTSTGGVEIHAYRDGQEMGWVRFSKLKTGQVKAAMVHVPERLRRQGVASAMYRYARQELGLDIVPSDTQTEHGRAFWNKVHEDSEFVTERKFLDQSLSENFADGKNPGRKGLAKRSGVNTKASVTDLRKTANNSSGEKQRMAHWLANMKSGRNKNK